MSIPLVLDGMSRSDASRAGSTSSIPCAAPPSSALGYGNGHGQLKIEQVTDWEIDWSIGRLSSELLDEFDCWWFDWFGRIPFHSHICCNSGLSFSRWPYTNLFPACLRSEHWKKSLYSWELRRRCCLMLSPLFLRPSSYASISASALIFSSILAKKNIVYGLEYSTIYFGHHEDGYQQDPTSTSENLLGTQNTQGPLATPMTTDKW